MNKREVIALVRAEFKAQFDRLKRASDASREEATNEENKSEGKYDTRSVEASYLAAGQADRAETLAASLQTFNAEPFPAFPKGSTVAVGALVEVDFGDEIAAFLLAPTGGGMTVDYHGVEVTLLAPSAPLRRQLQGLKAGDTLKQPRLKVLGVY